MPPTAKWIINLLLDGPRQIELHTWMTSGAVLHEIWPERYSGPEVDPLIAKFDSLNPMDQEVIVQLERSLIRGVVIAPFLRKSDVSEARRSILQ